MIYLDHNATAPLLPAARAAMLQALDDFGNPSSAHQFGRTARARLEASRRTIAEALGVASRSVLFTSGGTESNNLALLGSVGRGVGRSIAMPAIEHPSVLEAARELERCGTRIQWLPLGQHGRVDAAAVASAIDESTALVSVGWANNEIGTVQDVDAVAAVCRRRGVPLHSDAVQAVGRLGLRLPDADLVSVSAHKLGGPRGIGLLVRRSGATVQPRLFGGAQERGLRPGTENVAAAAGFAAAFAEAASAPVWSADLRERLWSGLADLPGIRRYSAADGCLPNTLAVGVAGIRGESLVAALDLEGIAVSVGSACAAGSGEPSHVLKALGWDDDSARGGVRFSTGRNTTESEIDAAIAGVRRVVAHMRVLRRAMAGGER